MRNNKKNQYAMQIEKIKLNRELSNLLNISQEIYRDYHNMHFKSSFNENKKHELIELKSNLSNQLTSLESQKEACLKLDFDAPSFINPNSVVEQEVINVLESLREFIINMNNREMSINYALVNALRDIKSDPASVDAAARLSRKISLQQTAVMSILIGISTINIEIHNKNAKVVMANQFSTKPSERLFSAVSYIGRQIKNFMSACASIISSCLKIAYNGISVIKSYIVSMLPPKKQPMRPDHPVASFTLNQTSLHSAPENSDSDVDCSAADLRDNSPTRRTGAQSQF